MAQCLRFLLLRLTIISIIRGGSAFGYDVDAKLGYSKKQEAKYASASREQVERMHISYNVRERILQNGWNPRTDFFSQFPRVIVRLDEASLELDDECRSRLNKVADFNSMSAFFSDYG